MHSGSFLGLFTSVQDSRYTGTPERANPAHIERRCTTCCASVCSLPILNAMSRTLASFLADRPEGELHEMLAAIQEARQRLRQEEERLKVEESLIQDALSRKTRRTAGSGTVGSSRISRGQVLRILTEHGRPVTIAEATRLVEREHPNASRSGTRGHMHRLKDDGKLIQEGRLWRVRAASSELARVEELEPVGSPDPSFFERKSAEQTSANGQSPEAEERETGFR